jgi:hypothetical protein
MYQVEEFPPFPGLMSFVVVVLGFFCCLFFVVLGLDPRAYTLSHPTSPFL